MDIVLTILQVPLYVAGYYFAGLVFMLPGMVISKGLEGAYPKWQAHVGIALLGFVGLALWFGARQGLF